MDGDDPSPRRAHQDLAIDVSASASTLPLARARIRALGQFALRAEGVRHAILSIALVGPRQIAALNRRVLGHAGSTDIITLAFRRDAPAAPVIADIYIAPDVARRNARRRGVRWREEIARLVIHGVLHALGGEHPEREGRESSPMWRRQERLLQRAGAQGLW